VTTRVRIAIAAATVAAAGAGVVVVKSSPEDDALDRRVWGCAERIDGFVEPPDREDTIIGPIAFTELPESYRWSVRHPKVPMKSVAVLESGARVTLAVPGSQRRWLSMGYGAGRSGRVTLQACTRADARHAGPRGCETPCSGGPTLFAGGFGVRFRRAPLRGLCAKLIVRVEGGRRAYRGYLFDPPRDAC
jgi:hypothetical protein